MGGRFYLVNPLTEAMLLLQHAFWLGVTCEGEATAARPARESRLSAG